jgi:hypothetical protein
MLNEAPSPLPAIAVEPPVSPTKLTTKHKAAVAPPRVAAVSKPVPAPVVKPAVVPVKPKRKVVDDGF